MPQNNVNRIILSSYLLDTTLARADQNTSLSPVASSARERAEGVRVAYVRDLQVVLRGRMRSAMVGRATQQGAVYQPENWTLARAASYISFHGNSTVLEEPLDSGSRGMKP